MRDTKLITLLRKFSNEELKELEKFVASPFFSRGRDFVPLFKILKQFHPDFNEKKLTKEFLFKKIYPHEKYSSAVSDNKLKILFSGLHKLCMDFLIQIELNEDNVRKEYYLLKQLSDKRLDNEFERVRGNSFLNVEYDSKGSVFDLIDRYYLFAVSKNYALRKDDYKVLFEYSGQMHEELLTAFLIDSLKYQNEKAVMHAYNMKQELSLTDSIFENFDLEKFLEKIKDSNSSFYNRILIYHTFSLMQKTGETKYFLELRTLLKENLHLFGRFEKHAFWVAMIANRGYKKRFSKDIIFEKELFLLNNEMLEYNIYNTSDKSDFNIVMFRNIVLNSSALGETKWLKDFTDKYSCELPAEHREDMKHYSLAFFYFTENDFEKALEHAIKVKFELYLYKIDMKIMLLKIFYELKYFEQALSIADTTLHFLKNTDKLPDYFKINCRSFISHAKELLKITLSSEYRKEDMEFLEKRVIKNKGMNSHPWIMSKINLLKKEQR